MNPNQTDIFEPLFAELDRRLAGNVPVHLAIEGGSVVVKDISDNSVAIGNPCRVIRPITEADRNTVWDR